MRKGRDLYGVNLRRGGQFVRRFSTRGGLWVDEDVLASVREINATGDQFFDENKYEDAMVKFKEALKVLGADNSTECLMAKCVLYNNIGNTAAMLSDLEQAENFFRKSISLRKHVGARDEELLVALYELANFFLAADKIDKAFSVGYDAYELSRDLRLKLISKTDTDEDGKYCVVFFC